MDSCRPMWNVEERFEQATLDALPSKGFQVSSTGGVMRVEKYGCGSEFRRTPNGRYQMTILPAVVYQGQFTRLWDAGYQKFLITDDRRKIPALAPQLGHLRQFNEELRYAIGVPDLLQRGAGLDVRGDNVRPRAGAARRRAG